MYGTNRMIVMLEMKSWKIMFCQGTRLKYIIINQQMFKIPISIPEIISNMILLRSNQQMVVIPRLVMLVELLKKALMIHKKMLITHYGQSRLFLSLSFFEKS